MTAAHDPAAHDDPAANDPAANDAAAHDPSLHELVTQTESGLGELSALPSEGAVTPGAWRKKLSALCAQPVDEERRIRSREILAQQFGGASGWDLDDADLSRLDLRRFDLRNASLVRANLCGTRLDDADLAECNLSCAATERASFERANLVGLYAHATAFQVTCLRGANLAGAQDVTGALFHGCDLRGADLRGANLAGSSFYQCNLEGAVLDSALLAGCSFNESVLVGASLREAVVDDLVITRCNTEALDLTRARGSGVVFQRLVSAARMCLDAAQLPRASFRRCHLDHSRFSAALLLGAAFTESSLSGAEFGLAALDRSRFDGCSGVSPRFVGASLAFASFMNCHLASATLDGCTAEGLHVSECSLPNASFKVWLTPDGKRAPFMARALSVRDSDLTSADFDGAYLYRAFFTGDPIANMRLDGATFRSANLIQCYLAASLRGANLVGVRAAYARLNQAILDGADLSGADLFEASLIKTSLQETCLREVSPPVFLDRCAGFGSGEAPEALLRWKLQLETILSGERRGST